MNPWFYFIMGVALSLLVWLISRFVSNRKENTTVLKKQKKTFENYNDRQHQRDGLNEALKKRHEQQRNFNEVLRRRQEQQGNLDKKSATPPLLRQPTNPILRPRMLPPSNKYSPPPSLRKDGSPFIPKPYIANPSVDVISIKTRPYKSAFASYAREDSNLVVGRLSEIEQNGIKIFWDRLNLHNHEKWKSQLENAIKDSEAFLLFWSSHASQSEWVKGEWQTALQHKGLRSIEPHPLEGPDEAPPPDELKELHFDDKYLYFRNRNK